MLISYQKEQWIIIWGLVAEGKISNLFKQEEIYYMVLNGLHNH